MDPALRTLKSQQAAQQEQLAQLIKSLPKEVRKERRQEIDALQGNLSKSARTLRDISAAGALSSRGPSRASTAASSGGRSFASARSTPSARQLRNTAEQSQKTFVTAQSREDTRREPAFQPPSRRSSQQSSPQVKQFAPLRTPPGAEMARPPQRWSPSASADNLDTRRYRPASARGSARGGGGSAASLGSARSGGSFRDDQSEVSSSVYSGCSTPIAGRTWGHLTRQFGAGIGKQHYQMTDHLNLAAEDDAERATGQGHDDDFVGGLERCIGHGRRFLGGEKCHLAAQCIPETEDVPGLHGHYKGDDFEGGIERYVGKGLRKYDRKHYHRHHITDDIESEPGLHGHTRDFDYKDGMEWYIGHGKRRAEPSHNIETWKHAPKTTTVGGAHTHCTADYRAAGMSTRDIMIHNMARDPTRQGTHQDRRQGRPTRRDQVANVKIVA